MQQALAKNPDMTNKQVLDVLRKAMINARTSSKQEDVWHLLGLPLYEASRVSVFAETRRPEQRELWSVPRANLERLDPQDTRVWVKRITDYYRLRPNDHANWESMSLFQFAAWMTCGKLAPSDDLSADAPIESQQRGSQRRLPPLTWNPNWRGGLDMSTPPFVATPPRLPAYLAADGRLISMQQRASIVLTYPGRNTHEGLLAEMLLHVPFRDEARDVLLRADGSEVPTSAEAFQAEVMRALQHHRERMEQLCTDANLPRHWLLHTRSLLRVLDTFEFDSLGLEGERVDVGAIAENAGRSVSDLQRHDNEESSDSTEEVETESVPVRPGEMNAEQQMVYRQVLDYLGQLVPNERDQARYDRAQELNAAIPQRASEVVPPTRVKPPRIFCTGPAGTGKSFLIHQLRLLVDDWAKRHQRAGNVKVLLCAPSGIAAVNISGQTLHSAFIMPLVQPANPTTAKKSADMFSAKTLGKLQRELEGLVLVIIDEVSMVSAYQLWEVNRRLNAIMGATKPDSYFGDVAVVLFGDFYQLQPVGGSPIYPRDSLPSTQWLAPTPSCHHLFRDLFRVIQLKRQMRQASDPQFRDLLNRLRRGKLTDADRRLLLSRVVSKNPAVQAEYERDQDMTHLYRTKKEASKKNEERIKALAASTGNRVWRVIARDTSGAAEDATATVENRKSDCALPEELQITLGVRLMLRLNLDLSAGLVNGVIGELREIEWATPSAPEAEELQGDQRPATLWVAFPTARPSSTVASKRINGEVRNVRAACADESAARARHQVGEDEVRAKRPTRAVPSYAGIRNDDTQGAGLNAPQSRDQHAVGWRSGGSRVRRAVSRNVSRRRLPLGVRREVHLGEREGETVLQGDQNRRASRSRSAQSAITRRKHGQRALRDFRNPPPRGQRAHASGQQFV